MKVLSVLFVFALSLLTGCSSSSGEEDRVSQKRTFTVLSTTAIIDDLVGQIGGEEVAHQALILGDLDPHSYELVKGDDEKFMEADLVVANGLGLEHGASMRYWIEKHPHALCLGDAIRVRAPEKILTVDRALDPHVWMDLTLWSLAIEPLVEALSMALPEHALLFSERGQRVERAMRELDQHLRHSLGQIPKEKRFLVTSHDAFNYFARAYLAEEGELEWQERVAAPEGLAPDGQLSPADIRRIVDHLCKHKAQVVFSESNVSRDALRKVVSSCREMGHEVVISADILYGDVLGAPGSGADAHLKMIAHNAAVLVKNWERVR